MKIVIGIIATIIFVILANLWFLKPEKGIKTESTRRGDTEYEAESFVKQLDKLGYFKYANSADLDTLKATFIKEFDPESELTTVWDEETNLPKDYRYYFCDGETIFEQGGIAELLAELNPVFKKMNFECEITNHVEEWDEKNNWLNHKITINGTEYLIFKNFKGYGWGEAPYRITQILNMELKKQNINEQIYLVNGGNDGRLALLTEEQYDLIYSTYKDKKWKPLEINKWAEEFELKPMKLD